MRIALVVLVLLAGGCASNVAVDYRSGTDFQGYASYAFAPPGEGAARSLDGQRIEAALGPLLQACGLESASVAQADLLVHYRVEDTRRLESSGFGFGMGFGRDNVGLGLGTTPQVYEVREGRLVLELEDRAANQVVWHAESRRHLSPELSGDKRTERIRKLVAQMLERYPPDNGRR